MSLEEILSNVDQGLLGLQPNISPKGEQLHISVSWVEVTAMMMLAGEVDMATAPLLHGHLDEMMPSLRAGLVIDLSRVTFLDSSGLAFLVTANGRISNQGGRLVIYAPTRQIRRLFAISVLSPVLTVVPDDSELD